MSGRCGVSSALVHYHFATKRKLLAAAADRIVDARTAALKRAVEGVHGLGAVDALWSAVASRAGQGEERAWIEVSLAGATDPDLAGAVGRGRAAVLPALAARVPALLRELGAAPAAPVEEIAAVLLAALDGAALALSAGERAESVRAAYDALWLVLLGAGPLSRRR